MAHSAPYVPHPDDADLAWAPDGLPAKIVITGEVIQQRTLGSLVEIFERLVIIDTLNRNGWHRKAAAKTLGISRVTLFNKMRAYGLTGTGEAAGEPVGVEAAQSVEPVVDEPVDDVSDVPDFNEDDIVMIPIEIFDFLDEDDDEVNS